MDNKVKALAKFLGIKSSDIECDDFGYYIASDYLYKVLTEEEANKEFYRQMLEANEMLGLEGLSQDDQEYIKENFIENEEINWKEATKYIIEKYGYEDRPKFIGNTFVKGEEDKEHCITCNGVRYCIYVLEEC